VTADELMIEFALTRLDHPELDFEEIAALVVRRGGPERELEFAARNLAYLKGDWTNGDAAIGALLRDHGREGVPLYLLYPAGGGPPALLPQVLTEGIVLRALDAPG